MFKKIPYAGKTHKIKPKKCCILFLLIWNSQLMGKRKIKGGGKKNPGETELFYFFLENPKQISNSNIPISSSCF